ncbi:MAG: hypothetical protein IMW89_14020, partial [Ktedonobacteraceae bacterium]|nr:hypothetical protein [Ktedonobacteraceae bacterium]
MRWRGSVLLLLLLLLSGLSACSPGHLGSSVIAFVRDGHIWTIDPNGNNALEIVAQDTPAVGFAWSPTHQILMFRALDGDFARTAAARQLKTQPITGQVADVPSTANTVGVDGGSPIPIAFSSPEAFYSNAMWNINGTRLLFRQTGKTPPGSPDGIRWWISQNDQPGGIAIKTPPSSFSIPSFSYDVQNQRVAVNSRRGLSTTTQAGTDEQFIQREPLAGHPLPASLERVLWQPAHQNAALLYALPVQQSQQSQQSQQAGERLEVQLVLHALNGQKTVLATCACVQFAWAPDGKYVLYSDGTTYTVLNLSDHTTFTLPGAADSVPYWSPDSRFLLLDGQHTLT